jgi:hypothetical protein
MGYSFQRYLVAVDDTLYRMANTEFARMLRDPGNHRLPQLAGQRVRTIEVAVALAAREPVAVVRKAFAVLAFDHSGCLDASRLRKQQYARIENALAPALSEPEQDENVVVAATQFIAQGGTWTPSAALEHAIDEASLGRRRCPRLITAGPQPKSAPGARNR